MLDVLENGYVSNFRNNVLRENVLSYPVEISVPHKRNGYHVVRPRTHKLITIILTCVGSGSCSEFIRCPTATTLPSKYIWNADVIMSLHWKTEHWKTVSPKWLFNLKKNHMFLFFSSLALHSIRESSVHGIYQIG